MYTCVLILYDVHVPTTVQVVKVRGAAMAAAAASGGRPHGMLSVVGLSDEQLQQV